MKMTASILLHPRALSFRLVWGFDPIEAVSFLDAARKWAGSTSLVWLKGVALTDFHMEPLFQACKLDPAKTVSGQCMPTAFVRPNHENTDMDGEMCLNVPTAWRISHVILQVRHLCVTQPCRVGTALIV